MNHARSGLLLTIAVFVSMGALAAAGAADRCVLAELFSDPF